MTRLKVFCPTCDLLMDNYNQLIDQLNKAFDYEVYQAAQRALTALIEHRTIRHGGAQ